MIILMLEFILLRKKNRIIIYICISELNQYVDPATLLYTQLSPGMVSSELLLEMHISSSYFMNIYIHNLNNKRVNLMSTPQSNDLLHFIKTVLSISIAFIVFSSPCRAEEVGIPENLSGDPVLTHPVSKFTKDISPLQRRMKAEEKIYGSSYVLAPHRQNYFLVINYNSDLNKEIYENTGQDAPKNYEAKFQISFKVLTWKKMFGDKGDLFVAYTQRSVWQLYDEALSSPFRDTNFEPEVFVKFDTDFNLGGLKNRFITIGFNHQSNGESESLSRSWNRIYAAFVAERGNLALILKPWYRIPEKEENDDNPNIEKYLGYGELTAAYLMKEHVFTLMFRNNLRANENRGAVELGWSYPFTPKVRVYVQCFNGYGESLIDYNNSVNRIGFGIMLNDWI